MRSPLLLRRGLFVLFAVNPIPLEREPKLRLELPVQRGLRINTRDQAEVGVGVVDIRIRRARLRMVEYIQRIQSELNGLGLADLDGLAHIRVKAPLSRSFQSPQAGSASPSGKGILKQNLAAGIRDRIECA